MTGAVSTPVGTPAATSARMVSSRRSGVAGVDVTAGLQPQTEPLVPMQHHATGDGVAHHDRRGGDVHRCGVLVEGMLEAVELLDERDDRRTFTCIDRRPGAHGVTQVPHQLGGRRPVGDGS